MKVDCKESGCGTNLKVSHYFFFSKHKPETTILVMPRSPAILEICSSSNHIHTKSVWKVYSTIESIKYNLFDSSLWGTIR